MIVADSIAIDELLLVLKVAFLVLLYLFIWQIVRTASRDVRAPQESMIIRPGQAGSEVPGAGRPPSGRLVVVESPTLPRGEARTVDSRAVSIGRGTQNDIELRGDQYASAAHARIHPRRDGVWLEDLDSTNGTFVNGVKVERARKLAAGDLIKVGETSLRFET